MKELNKNEIYSLDGLNREQRLELALNTSNNAIVKEINLYAFVLAYKLDKWLLADLEPTAKAIDLFEDTQSDFKTITDSIASLLEYKNEKYGNAALEPLNIFTNKTQVGQRIDDKLARIKNSDELRKNDVADLIGYLLLECKFRGWNNFDEFKD